MRPYSPGEARLPAVQAQMVERDEFLMEIREQLSKLNSTTKNFMIGDIGPLNSLWVSGFGSIFSIVQLLPWMYGARQIGAQILWSLQGDRARR
jgi:hypothetical protein